MSNRIAAAAMTDRLTLDLAHWAPRPSRFSAMLAWAQAALQVEVGAPFTLSAHLRRDLGLATAAAAPPRGLDVESRRLGF